MKRSVEEGVETQHASELNQPVQSGNLAHRCDGYSNHQKEQSEHAGGPRDKLKRVSADLLVIEIPKEQAQRHQSVNKQEEF